MILGALAGIPTVTRVAVNRSLNEPSRLILIPTPYRRASERSPLITRTRQSHRESEACCNWRIATLFMILVIGVFIGVHLMVIECKMIDENSHTKNSPWTLSLVDNEWPVNYPFHLIDRTFWYRGESTANLSLTPLNSSQVSNVVVFHTRGDCCFDFSTCLSVINEMQVSDFRQPWHRCRQLTDEMNLRYCRTETSPTCRSTFSSEEMERLTRSAGGSTSAHSKGFRSTARA